MHTIYNRIKYEYCIPRVPPPTVHTRSPPSETVWYAYAAYTVQ